MDFNISNDDNEDSFGDTLVTKPSHDDNNTDEVIKNESNDELPQIEENYVLNNKLNLTYQLRMIFK